MLYMDAVALAQENVVLHKAAFSCAKYCAAILLFNTPTFNLVKLVKSVPEPYSTVSYNVRYIRSIKNHLI